jgi:ABC-type antimicrobial peptide transport system permease subunit
MGYEQQAAVSVPHPPPELQSYERVDNVPVILAVALGALGVGILSHALVTSIRRRRRELGVLKTVGFVRPQVGVAVVCEATTLIALALLVGLPLGVAAGRWAWPLFADQLGVVAEPVVSFPYGLILVAAIALALANMVAAPPGRSAARTRPAVALRSE